MSDIASNPLARAFAKMPPHGEVTEAVRLALRDHKAAKDMARAALVLRQTKLGGDVRTATLAFDLWLEGR